MPAEVSPEPIILAAETVPDTIAALVLDFEDTFQQPDSPNSLSSSKSSVHTETSTLHYCQEPWVTYSQRVEKLCLGLWPPQKSLRSRFFSSRAAELLRSIKYIGSFIPSVETLRIKRIDGGDYNRIVGVDLSPRAGTPEQHFILRIPRDIESSHLDRDVALLSYTETHSTIPVPIVYAKDFTGDNPLKSPYVIQERIQGEDLAKSWNDLSHEQRCGIARAVGTTVRKLMAMETPTAGIINASSSDASNRKIIPFELRNALGELEEEPESEIGAQTCYPDSRWSPDNILKTQIGRWRANALNRERDENSHVVKLHDDLLKVVQQMSEAGLFEGDSMNCLCHMDLQPRNIMAKTEQDRQIVLTAVLDWDEAVFAPKFVNCRPPWWLWNRSDDNLVDLYGYELSGANDTPSEPQDRELKRIFEESAGPDYVRLAYGEIFRLGRGLFSIATKGLRSSETFQLARRILEEWETLRRNL